MNGYERISAALKGEPVDQIPVMLHNFMMAAADIGVSMGQYREDPKIIARAFINSVEKYQLDGVLVDIDTATLAGSAGVPVQFPEEEPARFHGSRVSSLEEVKDLKPVRVEDYKYVQIWLEAVRLLAEYSNNEIFIRGNCDQASFSLSCSIRGTNDFMMDLMLAEESLVKELLDYSTDITCQFIGLMAQTGAHMVSNGDSLSGPDLLPPAFYEKFSLPYEARIVEEAHKAGLPYALHICGNTDSILEKMVLTGADAFELDYKTDILKAFDVLSNRATLIGNTDPSGVLALGSKELVEQKTRELVNIFGRSNRFILNAGCAIPPATPEENIRTFIETARKYPK